VLVQKDGLTAYKVAMIFLDSRLLIWRHKNEILVVLWHTRAPSCC